MYLLLPGRHHLLTNFQFNYLRNICGNPGVALSDINHNALELPHPIKAIIFAVTSANHSNTRRNPIPFYQRALAIQAFASDIEVPCYVVGIDDVGRIDDFGDYTIKKVNHELDTILTINPENTIVACSTKVYKDYEKIGYNILGVELLGSKEGTTVAKRPWEYVQMIANHKEGLDNGNVKLDVHLASQQLWQQYEMDKKVKQLFNDPIIGNDGDLTETRDYNVYVRQMDEIAAIKFEDTARFVKAGRIGDIGCAVGSWIRLAMDRFEESDFYGIEVSRTLYNRCIQRKDNGYFPNPFVFFDQKNAVNDHVFTPNSMNTIHTSSLTHEIASYGNIEELKKFIQNRYNELVIGGVWINRDVVGPPQKDKTVYLKVSDSDGSNDNPHKQFETKEALKNHIQSLSTRGRFLRFKEDYRAHEGYTLSYSFVNIGDQELIKIKLEDACEFITKKDYADNWQSEMHERFCFWTLEDWKRALKDAGFRLQPASNYKRNNWVEDNRYKGKVEFFTLNDGKLESMPYPITNMILIAQK